MLNELGQQLRILTANYPAGQDELATSASRWTFAPPLWHAVGNGAAELIKILGGLVQHGLTVPVPTYNEFENSTPRDRIHRVPLDPHTMDFDPELFLDTIRRSGSDWAVVVSPNNPTGTVVAREVLLDLARRLESMHCRLLVDESFIDFCPDASARTVERDLHEFPNLIVLKSLTKSCGCLGLRLGYLLSADVELVRVFRARLPVFNVNGVAEWFLRLLPRYRKDFMTACHKMRADTEDFFTQLAAIPWLTCWYPEANFTFCRVDHDLDAVEIARRLFIDRRILVKHCAGKALPDGERYLRLGSRTRAENSALVNYLVELGAMQKSYKPLTARQPSSTAV
jgi:histidinol-phosphate/aromatic aminotransferase/cobyric acid decarboxylase-like protein